MTQTKQTKRANPAETPAIDNCSLSVKQLGKRYVIGGLDQQHDSFRDLLTNTVLAPWRRYKQLRDGADKDLNVESERHFWALQGLDFAIEPGQIVGVIGHNGAGKSTLLKILTRITTPTEGEVRIRGRVASLLEVGTGFHPELSGRENIYLNGSILGMTRAEIARKFDDIVAFAEIEKFIDTPVKRYSSGMYVRLAFAVAANLDADVLLVDEVLAVGDQEFQKRCLGKLDEVSKQGRTIFFVSHNLSAVSRLCNRALVLDKGQLVFDGDVYEGIAFYTEQSSLIDGLSSDAFTGDLYPDVLFEEFSINSQVMQQGIEIDPLETANFIIKGQCQIKQSSFKTVLSIRKEGQLLFHLYDSQNHDALPQGSFESSFKIPEKLLTPGEYSFSIGGANPSTRRWLWTKDYRFFVAHRWLPDYDTSPNEIGLINICEFGERKIFSTKE